MGQGCEALLEPKWAGVHDLLTRLLGRCTCEQDGNVARLYTVQGGSRTSREPAQNRTVA